MVTPIYHLVDQVLKEIYLSKVKQEGKAVHLSLLLPCTSNLNMHAKKANYIAKI